MPYKDEAEQRAAQHESYQRNKDTIADRVATKRRNNRIWFSEYKKKLSCKRCGESHPACIEFHHLDPSIKESAIGAAACSWSLERLQAEIAKCIPVCSNCHKKIHWELEQDSPPQRYTPTKGKCLTDEQRARQSIIMQEYHQARNRAQLDK